MSKIDDVRINVEKGKTKLIAGWSRKHWMRETRRRLSLTP